MTVFRALSKPDRSWETRRAPLLHEIMFCIALTYVKGGAILGHNKHILSMNTKCQVYLFKLLTLSHLLPLTFQFTTSLWSRTTYYISLLLTALDIIYSSLNTSKHWQFTFSTPTHVQVASALSAQFIWYYSGWKCGWERNQLVSMQAASIASKIQRTDVNHQDIHYNRLYLLYYTYNKHCNQ